MSESGRVADGTGRARCLRWLAGSGWPLMFGVLLASSAESYASLAAWCFAALFVTLLLDMVLPELTASARTQPSTDGHGQPYDRGAR